MGPRNRSGSPIAKRLKQARVAAGFSQKELGVRAGIDEGVASSRVNHYEQGRHEPSFKIVKQLARPLGIPASYFFTEEDDLAEVILKYRKG